MQKRATPIDEHIGRQIRARRKALHMSQGKLGQLLGLTFQQIQKYENGANRIGAGRLFEFARALGVGILYFYEGILDELSGHPFGFAEDEAPPPKQRDFEVAELTAAFIRIKDPAVRKQILELVKSTASDLGKGRRR
ncbi:MAG: helix-turn-helix domain-containing protein [Rhizomicrobium sp.]